MLSCLIVKILDTKPIEGMDISPRFGLAALNSLTPIKVKMTPAEILKFDARVMIQVRGQSKMLELRMAGESEEPIVEIDMVSIKTVFSYLLLLSSSKSLSYLFSLNSSSEEFIVAQHLPSPSQRTTRATSKPSSDLT